MLEEEKKNLISDLSDYRKDIKDLRKSLNDINEQKESWFQKN